MIKGIIKKMFGSANERIINSLHSIVVKINEFEANLKTLSDEELKAKTIQFKERIANGESLDQILPEAFAVVREASTRVLKMRHFDEQLIGGIVLHRGMIAEMMTGEGKTLVATLPAYLNALSGNGVHIVTVNEYLVRRDAAWVGKIHEFLGLTVGCVVSNLSPDERRRQYEADITYGTNNEFGFDYLRDNLRFAKAEMVQKPFSFAIVDEVDSILIDESRTPLIISGPADDYSHIYTAIDKIIPLLKKEDFELDEKVKSISLTESGNIEVEKLLQKHNIIKPGSGLFDLENMSVLHHLNLALKAYYAFTRDIDYIVKDGKVMIIDEFTGRIMEGRRFSEGLHQALEAKERVKIMQENQTIASITFQNYFRMYPKLAGMTGTAATEANEFVDIYKLEVVSIPTHKKVVRADENDIIYRTIGEKYKAIIEEIKQAYKKGQPVLVGTISIEKSELLSKMLKKEKIKHNVLNARFHDKEAEIIAQAGQLGAVTVATNMAGRGTDIVLGGNPEALLKALNTNENSGTRLSKMVEKAKQDGEKVKKLGGLLVIGTERHESRRIDNQLRGRSGRQGDPGRTIFFLSLEDDLMRLFGSEKISAMLQKLGLKEGEAITHSFIDSSIAKAQQKVEARNYEARKNLLKFDNVMNQQRKIIYAQRLAIMELEDVFPRILEIANEIVPDVAAKFMPKKTYKEQWNIEALEHELHNVLGMNINVKPVYEKEGAGEQEIIDYIISQVEAQIDEKKEQHSERVYGEVAKYVMMTTLDQVWKEHLHTLDHLKQGIYLRAYAQKDPLNEYKFESFNLFKEMLNSYSILLLLRILSLKLNVSDQIPQQSTSTSPNNLSLSRVDPALISTNANENTGAKENAQAMGMSNTTGSGTFSGAAARELDPNDPSTWGKVMRNSHCPCGSGKKYKHCHGLL